MSRRKWGECKQQLMWWCDLGPVVKNVTFRNVDKNPANLENFNVSEEYSFLNFLKFVIFYQIRRLLVYVLKRNIFYIRPLALLGLVSLHFLHDILRSGTVNWMQADAVFNNAFIFHVMYDLELTSKSRYLRRRMIHDIRKVRGSRESESFL